MNKNTLNFTIKIHSCPTFELWFSFYELSQIKVQCQVIMPILTATIIWDYTSLQSSLSIYICAFGHCLYLFIYSEFDHESLHVPTETTFAFYTRLIL